jgi:4-amino-4-deoxy-L-arabinose transferase-like glycosyltransferase
VAALVAGIAVLLLPSLGQAPLERAEIYFLDAARGMVETGDFIVPRYQGEPFFDKPILSYWLMALAMEGLGPTPAAARLVSVLATLAAALTTVWLGAILFDRKTALLGGVVFSTTLAVLAFSRMAMSDMLLVTFTTGALAAGVRAYRPRPPWWNLPLLGALLGLGFATKGPIALLVPGLGALVLFFERERRLPSVRRGEALGALAALLLLGLSWFGLVFLRVGGDPLVHFFFRENVERFAGDAYDVGRPFWFYLPAYLAEGLPWSPLLPIALWRLLARRAGEEDRAGARFLGFWAALVLVPLSLSRGKIDYYLLPLYPGLALLVARYLTAVPWRALDRAWVRALLLLGAAALAVVLVRPPQIPPEWLPGRVAHVLLATVLGAGAAGLVVAARRPRPLRVLAVLGGTVSAAWLVLVLFFLPAFAEAQPNRAIARVVVREKRYRPDVRMALCQDPSRVRRDVLFRARITVEETCHLWSLAASRLPYLLLLTPDEHASFRAIPTYRQVATYRYVSARTLTLEGLFSSPRAGEIVLGANFATRDPVALRKQRREYRHAIQEAFPERARPKPRRRRPRP